MRRTILSSIVLGILIFFAAVGLINFYFVPLIFKTTENIGYAGSFTAQNIPEEIISQISYGLTKVEENGTIKPAAAESFTIDKDKIYTFKIKRGQKFHDGHELTASNLGINFKDVKSRVIDKYTIEYTLKNPYAPFLSSFARPILGNKLAGLGKYKVKDIDINGGFIRQISLEDKKDPKTKRKIFFYPTQKALKVALLLGEIDRAEKLSNLDFDSTKISEWEKIEIEKKYDFTSQVAAFYNNADPVLSNKKLRQALNYAVSNKVEFGERSFGPISPKSVFYNLPVAYKTSNIELAKTLLDSIDDKVGKIVISTPDEYLEAATSLQKDWKKIGIETEIKTIDTIPSNFQVLLYKVKLPEDPDQYILWHSNQKSNIIHYKNLRIDKLLEDGRSIADVEKRKESYSDFQKYLNDDAPALFYYYPTVYTLHKN